MIRVFSGVLLAFSAIFLTSCGEGDVLHVNKVVVNLSPVDGNPSSGYLELHGGRLDVELIDVISDNVLRLEMHETVEKNGTSTMQPLLGISVPRGELVEFIPGGKHLMIWGIDAASVKRGTLPIVFIFSNDDRIIVDAIIKKMGSPDIEPEKNQESGSE